MKDKKRKRTQKEKLTALLIKADESYSFEEAADFLISQGVHIRRRGHWSKDESYEGKDKDIWRCSSCGHWQSAKKRQDKMFYMRYCPYCGAAMDKPEESEKNGEDQGR